MAICTYCQQEMLDGTGCTVDYDEEKHRQRIKCGEEHWGEHSPALDGPCHDCGVSRGDYHHPGCDMEQCAACGEQRLLCPCAPTPTWQCPACRADLEEVGVTQIEPDLTCWTSYECKDGRWDVEEDETESNGGWELECRGCLTELPYDLAHALWDEMEQSWSGTPAAA